MSLYDGPLTGFDIESTGVDVFEDRIVTFSIIYQAGDGQPYVTKEWLINPGVIIASGASAVHGITTEYAQENGQDAKEALQDIYNHLLSCVKSGVPLVAYNCTFDCTMLLAELDRYGIDHIPADELFCRVIDPLVVDKATDKFRKGSRKLIDTASLHGYDLTNAHNSTADVEATLFVARALLYKKLKLDLDIETLQAAQKDWKAEQAASFQKYLRKTDPEAVINGEWPYQTRSN